MTEITLNNAEMNGPIVASMVESGKTYTQIRGAMLALDMVADANDAEAYLHSIGVEKNRKRGFADSMNAYLIESPRTQTEFYDWLKANASESAWKLRGQHDKVRQLTVALHVKLGGIEFNEVLYTES